MSQAFGWWHRFLGQHKAARRQDEKADRQVEEAGAELAESRHLLEQTQEKVAPLATIDRHNHYSDLIRDALAGGFARPHERGGH